MSRSKIGINPQHAAILTKVLENEGLTQSELSRKIHLSKQTITAIKRGRANITPATAEAIVKLFPHYNFKGLLGLEPFLTEGERVEHEVKKLTRELSEEDTLVELLNSLHGYRAAYLSSPDTGDYVRGHIVLRLDPGCSDSEILQLARSTPGCPILTLTSPDGTQIKIENDSYQSALRDIANFSRMRMQQLFEREEDGDNG